MFGRMPAIRRVLICLPPLLLAGVFAALAGLGPAQSSGSADKPKKIVFIAGEPSHGPGEHEHRAGCLLLAAHLDRSGLPLETVVVTNGWPADASVFDGASAVVIYADGGPNHPASAHLDSLKTLAGRGVGIGCIHYAVEIPKGPGGDLFLDAIGGYFETGWSVNPHWDAEFQLPDHAATRGLKDFAIRDEWYYHMRFRRGMAGITPILSALPPADSLSRPDGPHQGNPAVREAVLERKEVQHVMWAYERPEAHGGGRAFGFTGGHFHKNWQHDDHRGVVLNAIVWIAGGEVPEAGVFSATPSDEEMVLNLDPK